MKWLPFCPGRVELRNCIVGCMILCYGINMSVEKFARILCQYHDFLLMFLLLMLPRHQLPRYWIRRISGCISSTRNIMTSSNRSIFRVTGLVCGEFNGNRWFPLTRTSDAEPWCFLWSVHVQTVGQTIETPVIRGHCAHYDVIVMTKVPLQVIDVKWQIMSDR